jgi:hypothetical protein
MQQKNCAQGFSGSNFGHIFTALTGFGCDEQRRSLR